MRVVSSLYVWQSFVVVSSLYIWQSFVVVVVTDACPVPCRRHLRPISDRFVRDGSAPLALAAVVADDRRFGRAVDNDDGNSPSQSVSNIDRIMKSSSCSSSLLVSVVFVVILLLPKRPSQSWRRTTSMKSCAYPPFPRRCLRHPLLRRSCCRRCPPDLPAQ